jgi:biopolymer transport protein TolR
MAMAAPNRGGRIAEINVTPMADVMIVLLIIFMVTVPLIAEGPVRDLPPAQHAAAKPAGPVVLSITSNEGVFLGTVPLGRHELEERLRPALQGARERVVHVRAPAGLPYFAVAGVLDACRRAGAEEIAFIALPRPRS